MSAIGPERTFVFAPRMSAYRVKRTWLFAARMSALDPKRTYSFKRVSGAGTMFLLSLGGGNEAARIHITSWCCRDRLAACCACAAERADAARWCATACN